MAVDNLHSALQLIDTNSALFSSPTPRTVLRHGFDCHLTVPGPEMTGLEASDHSLLRRCHRGDQDAATHLHDRYAQRLTRLVRKRCPTALARCAGLEDIVQSVFQTFFRRVGLGFYEIPDGQALWKLLVVIALNRVQAQATYHYAAKRDAHRTSGGTHARLLPDAEIGSSRLTRGPCVLDLDEFLERLPPQDRLMAELRIDGYSVAEIARLAGSSRRFVERAYS